MHAQNANKNALYALSLLACGMTLITVPPAGFAQEPVPVTSSYVRTGHEFLRAFYPNLNEKGYAMTLESSLAYDDVASVPRYFMLDVGAGPKFVTLQCCIQGYVGGVVPSPMPPGAPELRPAAPDSLSSKTDKLKKYWDAEGRVHPKQYLTAAFRFDDEGRLTYFAAEGPSVGNREADNKLIDFVNANPQITDREIAAELKRLGAKYGPDDKETFVKDLPLSQLERFLGSVQLESVRFSPLDRTNLGLWPDWRAELQVTRKDGTKLKYKAAFDHFRGELTSLQLEPPRP